MSTQTIIQGDCLEVMKTFPDKSFDLCLTDPPYGINAGGILTSHYKKMHKTHAAKRRDYGTDEWDKSTPSKEYFDEMRRVSKKQVIFGGQYFTDKLPPSGKWVIWDKKLEDKYSVGFADCELAWTSEGGASRIVRHLFHGMIQQDMNNKDERYHPTQKPIEVMRWLIEKFTIERQSILDPFMGSGTTLVAAKYLNRNAVGIEISEKYCEIARKRLAQDSLFTSVENSLPLPEKSATLKLL